MRAWRLKPAERPLLLDAGRVWNAMGRSKDANAALLAASRGSRPRVAEEARELLPSRYPYVSEFRRALELDPANTELRRELAYLLLEMSRQEEAEREFRTIAQTAPGDVVAAAQLGLLLLARQDKGAAMPLLEKALASGDDELVARVRTALAAEAIENGFTLHVPPRSLCTDNAAMIAAAGYRRLLADGPTPLDAGVRPSLPLE